MNHGGGALVRCSIEWLAGGGQGVAWQDDEDGKGNQNPSVYVSHGEAGLSVINISMLSVMTVLCMQEVCQNLLSKVE